MQLERDGDPVHAHKQLEPDRPEEPLQVHFLIKQKGGDLVEDRLLGDP